MSVYVTEQVARHQISDRVRAAEQRRALRDARSADRGYETVTPAVPRPRRRFVPQFALSR